MDSNGMLNQLDRLVLVNTAMFYKMMLEDDTKDSELEERMNRIEEKLDLILRKMDSGQ